MKIDDYYPILSSKAKRQTKAKKFYECTKCGVDIIPGDLHWSFKPLPLNGKSHKWQHRCIECEPKYYNEIDDYPEK